MYVSSVVPESVSPNCLHADVQKNGPNKTSAEKRREERSAATREDKGKMSRYPFDRTYPTLNVFSIAFKKQQLSRHFYKKQARKVTLDTPKVLYPCGLYKRMQASKAS